MLKYVLSAITLLLFMTGCSKQPETVKLPHEQICNSPKMVLAIKPLQLRGDYLSYTQEEVQLHLKNTLLETGCFVFEKSVLFPELVTVDGTLMSNYTSDVTRKTLTAEREDNLRVNLSLKMKNPQKPEEMLTFHSSSIVTLESKIVLGLGRGNGPYEAAKRKALVLAARSIAQKMGENL